MSQERFLKYIPSQEALYLLHNHGHAFRLLTIIAGIARRESGFPDGLEIAEAFIGDWKSYGMSEQNYRTAKNVLLNRKHIEIIETNRTRKKALTDTNYFNSRNFKKPTTGMTTKGTKVKLISSNVYDINIFVDNDRPNDCLTTDQRLTNDDQEGYKKDKNDKKDHQSSLPSFSTKEVIDDFFPKKEKGIEIYKEVFLTQKEIDECVKIKGSLENVKDCIRQIIDNPGRKTVIKNVNSECAARKRASCAGPSSTVKLHTE